MKLEIRDILSPDAPQAVNDIENWRPPDEQTFGVLIEVFIGPRGEDSHEMFTLIVCTPSWLEQELSEATAQGGKPYILGHHHVVVRELSCSSATLRGVARVQRRI